MIATQHVRGAGVHLWRAGQPPQRAAARGAVHEGGLGHALQPFEAVAAQRAAGWHERDVFMDRHARNMHPRAPSFKWGGRGGHGPAPPRTR